MNGLALDTRRTLDPAAAVTHVSLCAGYGGIDLGLRRVLPDLRTVAYSEIEAFAVANLVAKMEAGLLDLAPVWSNLKTFPWELFRGRIRLLTGGYPCQPFSAAGLRLGHEDPRHLWPYILAGIKICLPDVCFFENVEGHISLGLRDVLQDLEDAGYRVKAGLFSASEVGAPHQRKRIFIMAIRNSFGGPSGLSRQVAGHEGDTAIVDDSRAAGVGLADSSSTRLQGHAGNGSGGGEPGWHASKPYRSIGTSGIQLWPSGPGQPQHAWEPSRTVDNTRRGPEHPRPERSGRETQSDLDWSGKRASVDDSECSERRSKADDGKTATGMKADGTKAQVGLENQVMRPENWATPRTEMDSGKHRGKADTLHSQIKTWPTPNTCPEAPNSGLNRGKDHGGIRPRNKSQCLGDLGEMEDSQRSEPAWRSPTRGEESGGRPHDQSGGSSLQGYRYVESPLGRDADGNTRGVDYAELCESSDNRIDELRLCGNGVLPATAERAYRVLWAQLT